MRGALISGKLVDEKGNEWQIGQTFGYANIVQDPLSRILRPTWGPFSLTDFRNKHRPTDVAFGSGGTFVLGEGSYEREEMLFPTKSTFVIQGMMPGHTMIGFLPSKEGQKVLKILHEGRDIMQSGIVTKPGQEVKDITIVVGAK